jgi:hypothetical protein
MPLILDLIYDTNTRGAAGSCNGRSKPPASCVFVRQIQILATMMDSIREGRFRHCRHSYQGGQPVARSRRVLDYSDHLNLTYIYNPLSPNPTLARHVVQKLQR